MFVLLVEMCCCDVCLFVVVVGRYVDVMCMRFSFLSWVCVVVRCFCFMVPCAFVEKCWCEVCVCLMFV